MFLSTKYHGRLAATLIALVGFQVFAPTAAFALTGGPSQPEVQGFTPINANDMVDPATGDFSYNIPLLNVGDYPINLGYHAGVTMDEEASWVGLGWNLNPGVINHDVRGLPDDFDGSTTEKDEIREEVTMRPNETRGGSLTFAAEIVGLDVAKLQKALGVGAALTIGARFNNYSGLGLSVGYDQSMSLKLGHGHKLTAGIGRSADSRNGIGISPSLGYSYSKDMKTATDADGNVHSTTGCAGLRLSSTYNSRAGLTALSISPSISASSSKLESMKTSEMINNPFGTASWSQTGYSYSPSIEFPMKNSSGTYHLAIGSEAVWAAYMVKATYNWSKQELETNEIIAPAFGFLNAEKANGHANALMDMNREQDGTYTKNRPHLAIPVATNDIYNVQGQGVSGQYQLRRGDIGILGDAYRYNSADDKSGGVDYTIGSEFKAGADISISSSISTNDRWDFSHFFSYRGSVTNNKFYEKAYFKNAGEKNILDESFFKKIGEWSAARIAIDESGATINAAAINTLVKDENNTTLVDLSNVGSPLVKNKREKRNQAISYLTAAEASLTGLETKINYYNGINATTLSTLDRTGGNSDAYRKAHHISEMTVTREDGARYIYGIAAYNISKEETSFSVAKPDASGTANGDCAKGLVKYNTADNSLDNQQGRERYYHNTTTPGYAHSYLLTAIVSPDYIDKTGDGPTDDDLGNYTLFHYRRIANKSNPYRWRVPYEKDMANYNAGLISDPFDDKANYVYGEKEVWYLNDIETKTQKAIFKTSNRKDALPVLGKNGGQSTQIQLQQLDAIELYTKGKSWWGNYLSLNLVKTVHLAYDNSLCLGIPNYNANTTPAKGKLTLKKVWFTYADSQKGAASPYTFSYNTGAANPTYHLKGYNRWGGYKAAPALIDCDLSQGSSASHVLSNADFPYIEQNNRAQEDEWAQAWCLKSIGLPSGGKIDVTYEADTYGYVQDKKAMQMVKIAGFGLDNNFSDADNSLYTYDALSAIYRNKNYLFFDLPAPVPQGIGDQYIKDHYLKDILDNQHHLLQFKCLVNLHNEDHKAYEYVPGYAKVEDAGIATDGQHGWIRLELTPLEDKTIFGISAGEANPIAKTGWNFAKMHTPWVAFNHSNALFDFNANTTTSSNQFVQELGGMITALVQFYGGPNTNMRSRELSKTVDLSHSWVRLQTPNSCKIGGGLRVKRIEVFDNWKNMAGGTNQEFSFGQEYQYEFLNNDKIESSGVAAYEPLIGGEENPFKQPDYYNVEKLLAPNDEFYMEGPMGESFFPSPSIVYSKVVVKNIHGNSSNISSTIKKTGTGMIAYEFYTAKDYPTRCENTGMKKVYNKSSPLLEILHFDLKESLTGAEGFVVENNDMHGKPKSQWVYPEGIGMDQAIQKNAISGTEYFYKNKGAGTKQLDNTVTTVEMGGDGKLIKKANQLAGVDVAFYADGRDATTTSFKENIQVNVDMSALIPVPPIWPEIQGEYNSFRSAVTMKHINRFGLLDSVAVYDAGALASTRNELYDAETGDVLLTRTNNEHFDAIYSLSYPAHWAYDAGMGPAYKNIGLRTDITLNELTTSSVNDMTKIYTFTELPDARGAFMLGDELLLFPILVVPATPFSPSIEIQSTTPAYKAWVTKRDGNTITIEREKGNTAPNNGGATPDIDIQIPSTTTPSGNNYAVLITRSGRRNQQSVSIGKWVSSKINPFADPNNILQNNNNSLDGTARILDAAAIQYKDNWLLNCDCSMKNSNPYSTGERGAWRAFRSFTYLTDRQEELVINKPNQRNDGIFKKFENFWQAGTNTGQFAVPVKYVPDNLPESDLSVAKGWGFTAQVTKIDPQGFELENRDALGRYSSEFNGYNSKLVVATAANAQHREVGTTNIEDLKKAACGSLRFFKAPVPPAAPPYSVNDAETNLANGDTLTAHSGKVSIVLKSGEIVQWKQRICSDKYKQPTLSQNGQNPQRTTKKQ